MNLKLNELFKENENLKKFINEKDKSMLYRQLEDMQKKINELNIKNKQLEKTALELNTEYQDLESRRESTTNPVAFNLQVKNYNTKVALYNAEVQTVSSLIDQYNQLLEKYNATVLQENELIKAIDSRPETIQTE